MSRSFKGLEEEWTEARRARGSGDLMELTYDSGQLVILLKFEIAGAFVLRYVDR